MSESDGPSEYRVIGPPGTGKTSYLSRQVRAAVEKHGSDSALVVSLTRAAAAEVAGRDLPLEPDRIGTLHSHAFHAVGRPKIANDRKQLAGWNDYVGTIGRPDWRITGSLDRDDFGGTSEETVGDSLLADVEKYRARMLPREHWPSTAAKLFAQDWDVWKERNYLKDFTDLIEICLEDVEAPPGNPRFIFVDEAQDLSRLEMELVRKWARHCEKLIVVGDPDQSIFGWRGASPRNFSEPALPEERYRELDRSYRVPRAPHRFALSWIRQIKNRRDVAYLPREEEGQVEQIGGIYKHPEFVFADAEKHLAAGKTVMFLATASYMLRPLVSFLRSEGIPFHNPYVEKRGDWNPLAKKRGTTIAERIRAFLYCRWLEEGPELKAWLKMLKLDHWRSDSSITQRVVESLPDGVGSQDIQRLFQEEALRRALGSDLDWLQEGMLSTYRNAPATDYAIRVARRCGETALEKTPQVVVGTVHSVKGGEADVVYVFPDLSPAADEEYLGTDPDSILRVFYVAFTRAKETLVLCDPASNRAVEFQVEAAAAA